MSGQQKPNNVRTALILGGLALFFFVSVFVKRMWLS
ncbi:MAG TPA: cytochrome oxidase small assembly protein [Duganella sp.]|nr:cytochrome oxidase small assembly protein [Duganella sp.]